MNRRDPDRISTLVDNELDEWELKGIIHALQQDAEMQARWRNYHLIGDAMRGHLPKHLCLDLGERVSRALEHEPHHLQPRVHTPSSTSANFNRTRTAAGFALAASLSAIAVVGVMNIGGQDAIPSGSAAVVASQAAAPVVATAPAPENPQFMYTFTADVSSLPADGRTQAAAIRGAQPAAPGVQTVAVSGGGGLPLANDLTEYLMNYQRFAQHEKDDTLSYLRLVGYGE